MTDNDYQCGVCGKFYVVRTLARDCEARHERAAHE
jgi:hypothetical protein